MWASVHFVVWHFICINYFLFGLFYSLNNKEWNVHERTFDWMLFLLEVNSNKIFPWYFSDLSLTSSLFSLIQYRSWANTTYYDCNNASKFPPICVKCALFTSWKTNDLIMGIMCFLASIFSIQGNRLTEQTKQTVLLIFPWLSLALVWITDFSLIFLSTTYFPDSLLISLIWQTTRITDDAFPPWFETRVFWIQT